MSAWNQSKPKPRQAQPPRGRLGHAKTGSRRRRQSVPRRGVAAVEFALLLPILTLLFVLAVDFARVYYCSLTVTNCARAGALYASDPVAAAESPFASLQAAALADGTNLSPQATVTSQQGTDALGQPYVEVTVSYPFSTITGFPGVPSSVQLVRTVRTPVAPTTPN